MDLTTNNKKLKRALVREARKAIIAMQQLRLSPEDYHRHTAWRRSITGLWLLGYTTEQITAFISPVCQERWILNALRAHLTMKRETVFQILGKLVQTEESTNAA